MKELIINSNPEVESVFNKYPEKIKVRILHLRRLILEAARESEEVAQIEETLKWGEPSYITKYGSTIRIDWKKNKPDQYAMYFKCTSKLVPTFRRVFSDEFSFEGDRAIIFGMNDKPPNVQLKKCITAGLTYHKVKNLPRLGLG